MVRPVKSSYRVLSSSKLPAGNISNSFALYIASVVNIFYCEVIGMENDDGADLCSLRSPEHSRTSELQQSYITVTYFGKSGCS